MSLTRPTASDDSNVFRAHLLRPGRIAPLIIAHRGDSFRAPENTLEAGRLGWQAGADAWELDVQLTRDQVPVVVHDDSLLRTTDVQTKFAHDPRRATGYLVSDFDLAEIQTLDAGSWFLNSTGPRTAHDFGSFRQLTAEQLSHYESGAVRIPTLRDALELTRKLDWHVNVEVKSFPRPNPLLLDAVLEQVRATDMASRVLISSFDHTDITRAIQLWPNLMTGVLTMTPLSRPEEYVKHVIKADAYHTSAEALGSLSSSYRSNPSPKNLRFEQIESLNQLGIPVLVYTVNETKVDGLAVHLAEAGVAGLFTDDPQGLRTRIPVR